MSNGDPKARILLAASVPTTLWAFYRRMPEEARRRGMEIGIAASPGPELKLFADQFGVATHPIMLARRISPFRDLLSLVQMARTIRRNRYDLVHAFTTKAGLVTMSAAAIAGVKCRVYSMLGLPAETATGLTRELLVASERRACRKAHVALACSGSLRDQIVQYGICAPPKLRVLADGTCCGVDTRRFRRTTDAVEGGSAKRAELGIPQDALVIGFIGRLVYDKGIHTIVDAFEAIAGSWPNLHLLLLGDYEPDRGRVPAETVKMIDSHPRIHHVAFDWDPVPYYCAMDVLALATLREGFPYALLEAACMELPAVATRATGCVDAVVDGETGILIEIGNTREMAEAFDRLLSDADLRHGLGQAARRRVEALFTDDRLLDEHLNLYESLLEGSAGRK